MVTEQGLYGIGLILIDTFRVLYQIYRTLDIEEDTYWHFVDESHRVAAVDTYKELYETSDGLTSNARCARLSNIAAVH